MRNFGKIKTIFNNLMAEGISSDIPKNKKLFKEYVDIVKVNEVIKNQFLVYNNIENKCETNESKAIEFVKYNIDKLSKYKKSEILEANKILSSIIKENGESVNDETHLSDLYENICDLIFMEENISNISDKVDKLHLVSSHILNNKSEVNESNDFVPNSMLASVSVDKFNEKYSDLTEDEKNILKIVIESDDEGKKDIIETLSKECLVLVNEHFDSESSVDVKSKLLDTKERLLEFKYNSDSFIVDINKLIDLKNNLS